jgi:hypothetical protein
MKLLILNTVRYSKNRGDEMAGIFVHLVIAREIIKLLPKGTILDESLFYAGSIAPDAIHAREGFVRADKKHTHLRDDILDQDFGTKENLSLFHKRVSDFIMKNRDNTGGFLDLYRGYVVHILTDELFMLTVRQEFCNVMEHLGIAQSDKEFYHTILTDMNRNDLILAKDYKEADEIRIKLEGVKTHHIKDFLSEDEIYRSREWVIHRYFYEENELLEPVYISYESILEFVTMAAREIAVRLSEGKSLPKMF